MPDGSRPTKMTDSELLGVIRTFTANSYGTDSGTLSEERAEALKRYNAEPYGDEVDGRSGVCTTDLRDTIEWMMPQLLRVFLGGDEVVRFDPKGPEDEQQAQQETDYINHVILEKNNAFEVFNTWLRDALLQKNGYVKTFWETKEDVTLETYEGLPEEAYVLITGDKNVEIVSESAYPDPSAVMGQMAAPAMFHDVKLRRLGSYGCVKIMGVPPEELRIHESTRSVTLQDALFVEHEVDATISELRQMGFDVPDDWAGLDSDADNDLEQEARDLYDESDEGDDESTDPATRRATLHECYVRVDYDGDGIAELRKVCIIKNKIVLNEEADLIPFAAITPIMWPHRHIGVSYYDLVKQIQQIATAITRQYLDNLYLSNNGRYAIDVNKVNVDDMLISRPGGIVRIDGDPGSGIFPLTHPQTGEAVLRGLDVMNQWRDTSTGINGYAQGMDPNSLNKTATGISQLMTAAQARTEAVARCFAETGVKDLFRLVHALTLKHATQPDKVRLRGTWVPVDPREWVKRNNLTVSVGLGTGSKETQIAQLQMLAQMQAQGIQIGIARPEHIYHTAAELTKAMGYKNADAFWNDPVKNPPPPGQKPPEVQAEEAKGQVQLQLKQVDAQTDMQKVQADAQTKQQAMAMQAEVQRQNDERQAQLDQQKAALDMAKLQEEYKFKYWLAEQELGMKRDLEQEKLKFEGQRMDMDAHYREREIASKTQPAKRKKVKFGRGPDGKLASVDADGEQYQVERDANGKMVGLH